MNAPHPRTADRTAAAAPLVLLHGWAMTPAVWDGLRARLAGAMLHTPPLPGHGAAAAAADLAAWADALATALPDGVVLGGWSLGAMLALEIARRRRCKVAGLVLIGATPRFVTGEDWQHGLAPDTVAAFSAGFAADPAATLKRFLALQCVGDANRRAVQQCLMARLADVDAGSALADGLQLLADSDLRSGLGALRLPCCIIHGENDALMPAGAARWLADALPHARLHLLPDCGHAVFLSQPEACTATIADFVAEVNACAAELP